MIRIKNSVQLADMAALRRLAKGLEIRFPRHNGPFEYTTRLAEEAGELIEVINEAKDAIASDEQKAHLAGEQIDVIRTVLGIAEIYTVADNLPENFDDFMSTDDPKNYNDYIVQLAMACGELANAVNHAEGMGIKAQKHGDDARRRVLDRTRAIINIVVWTARFYNAENELRIEIAARYHNDSQRGYIQRH